MRVTEGVKASRDGFRWVHLTALSLAVIMLPWSTAFLSIAQMLLAANWLAGAWDQNTGLFISTPGTSKLEQVALKWLLDQDGVAAIPKASRAESQQANLDALKLNLDDADRQAIAPIASTTPAMIQLAGSGRNTLM